MNKMLKQVVNEIFDRVFYFFAGLFVVMVMLFLFPYIVVAIAFALSFPIWIMLDTVIPSLTMQLSQFIANIFPAAT